MQLNDYNIKIVINIYRYFLLKIMYVYRKKQQKGVKNKCETKIDEKKKRER